MLWFPQEMIRLRFGDVWFSLFKAWHQFSYSRELIKFELNWRQFKTVGYRNFRNWTCLVFCIILSCLEIRDSTKLLFSLKYIEDYWERFLDSRQFSSHQYTTDTDKTCYTVSLLGHITACGRDFRWFHYIRHGGSVLFSVCSSVSQQYQSKNRAWILLIFFFGGESRRWD